MITIYTAIFGNYDLLKDPFFVHKDIKYICFTDNKKLKSNIWDIKIVKRELSPRREARKYKILSHKYIGSDVSLWIDGSCQIKKDPILYIKKALKTSDFFATKHTRNCLYKEAERCLLIRKGDPQEIKEQIERYRRENYPDNNGLIDSTVLLRKITPEVIKIENDWWNEIKNGCVRDQISFNYVAWKNNFSYGLFNYREIITRRGHKRR